MTKQELTMPMIHLNGSGKTNLMEPLMDASSALYEAIEKLQQTVPNARDYYVYTDQSAFRRAMDEHLSRLDRLQSVRQELAMIMEHVDKS